MASITFTDGTGAVTLTNGQSGPGNRFREWTPTINRVADRRYALGTGVAYEYLFREDSLASFAIEGLPATQMENVARFTRWALAGNTFTVNTTDNNNRVYTCRIAEGSSVEVSQSDPTFFEYTMRVTVANAQSPVVFMTVEYL